MSELEKFIKALAHLQKLGPRFPVQYAICLCVIALEEGISQTKLAERTGIKVPTLSRIVGALADQRQYGEPFGLVTVKPHPTEKRKKQLFLSPAGIGLITKMAGNLKI